MCVLVDASNIQWCQAGLLLGKQEVAEDVNLGDVDAYLIGLSAGSALLGAPQVKDHLVLLGEWSRLDRLHLSLYVDIDLA